MISRARGCMLATDRAAAGRTAENEASLRTVRRLGAAEIDGVDPHARRDLFAVTAKAAGFGRLRSGARAKGPCGDGKARNDDQGRQERAAVHDVREAKVNRAGKGRTIGSARQRPGCRGASQAMPNLAHTISATATRMQARFTARQGRMDLIA